MAKRKILDILPPKSYKQAVVEEKKIFERKIAHRPKRRSLLKRGLVLFFLLALILLACYFMFQRAELVVWPKTEDVILKEKLTVAENESYNFSNKIISGTIVAEPKEVPQEFPATGKTSKETKAEGIIRVYNGYSTSPQDLIATTRFVSAEGKLFRSVERVTVPGGKYEKGKLEPGSIDVKVQADQPGVEFNIEPSIFSIPGFAGTSRYTAFYGKSFEAMKGGMKGEVSQITQQDLDNAEKVLTEKLLNEVEVSLEKKIPDGFIFISDAVKKDLSKTTFSKNVGEEGNSFLATRKITIKTLVINKTDLENFAKEVILASSGGNKKIYEESLSINYFPETINLEKGRIVLNLDFSAKVYSEVNFKELGGKIAGKKLNEAEEILRSDPQLIKSDLKLWPPWPKKLPKDTDRIKIKLRIDPAPISATK